MTNKSETDYTATREYAENVELPFVDFEEASLVDVVEYLRHRSNTGIHVGEDPPPFRLNFVIIDPEETARPITLRMKSISLDRLCERVAQVSGVQVSFEEDAIVFRGKED